MFQVCSLLSCSPCTSSPEYDVIRLLLLVCIVNCTKSGWSISSVSSSQMSLTKKKPDLYFSKHLPEWRWKNRKDGRRVAMAWFLGANVNHPASWIADRDGLGVEAVILRDGVSEETPRAQ